MLAADVLISNLVDIQTLCSSDTGNSTYENLYVTREAVVGINRRQMYAVVPL